MNKIDVNKKITFSNILAVVFVIGFFVMSFMFKDVKDNNGVIEVLKAGILIILGFYYGSSKGSQDKDKKNKE